MFSWCEARKPLVALAPMAGVTDASYRQFIKRIAPEVIVFTEFLSSDAIHHGAERTLQMLTFDPAIERPFIVQIFGNNREHFIAACRVIEALGADGIDINMGCPAAKIVSSCYGSALMRRTDLAMTLVDAARSAVSIPVSVKTRLGWDAAETLVPFCQKLAEAGASSISIHGRTYCQKFSGEADWEPLYEVKRSVTVPVIGNGDIRTAQDALRKIGNLDGVMIGRGTLGNPWLLSDIVHAFRRSEQPKSVRESLHRFSFIRCSLNEKRKTIQRENESPMASVPQTFEERIPFIIMHCELAVRHKGEQRGILEMRKHFSGYVRGFEGAKEMRQRLMAVESLKDVERILSSRTEV